MRRLVLVLVLVALFAALLASGCGGGDDGASESSAASPQLTDLSSVDELKERFNADQGVPRLIVLVAPT